MSDIDVVQDLGQVTKQLEDLVGQLNALNTQREQLTQQVHNLNGIAMYLRGKQEEQPASTNGVVEELELTEEFPPEGV
jgi:cell division protein FtsB